MNESKVKERYIVIKFDFTNKTLKREGEFLDILKDNDIKYRLVEIVELDE